MGRPKKDKTVISDRLQVEVTETKPAGKDRRKLAAALQEQFADKMSLRTANHPGLVSRASEQRDRFIPFRQLALQAVTRTKGLVIGTSLEVLGQDGSAKSSLMYDIMGSALDNDAICLYVNTEGKWLTQAWRQRLLSSSVERGKEYLEALFEKPADSIQGIIVFIEDFVRFIRNDRPEMASSPIVIVVDSYSNSMPPEMAEGYVENPFAKKKSDEPKKDEAKGKSKFAKEKSSGPKAEEEVGQFGWSKMAHLWTTRLAYFLNKYNATLVVVSKQNTKIDMSGGPAARFKTSESDNRTKRGGTAFNFACVNQITAIKSGERESGEGASKNKIGTNVTVKCIKAGYGMAGLKTKYLVKQDLFNDNPDKDYQEQPIQMSEALCDLLQDRKMFGLRLYNGMYQSADLGLRNATPEEVEAAIKANPEHLAAFAKEFCIHGYETEYTNFVPEKTVVLKFDESDSIEAAAGTGQAEAAEEEETDQDD